MSVGVTAPLDLAKDEMAGAVANALIRMTEDFGFTNSGR